MWDAKDGDASVEPGQVGLDRRPEEARLRWIRSHQPERSSGGPTVDPWGGSNGT